MDRLTFNIIHYLRYNDWSNFKILLKILFFIDINTHTRELIILDTFITPFNNKIGCRIFGHRWKEDSKEQGIYYCEKCHEWTTTSEIRDRKINKIIK